MKVRETFEFKTSKMLTSVGGRTVVDAGGELHRYFQ